MNNISIVGRCGSDPKSITNGCAFSVAVNKYKKDAEPDWFDCACFGKTAEFVTSYITKGRLVSVTGRMDSRKVDGKTYWSLVASDVQGLDKGDAKPTATKDTVEEFDPFD